MSEILPETRPTGMSRARRVLNSPWVAGGLVIAMIAALRLIAPWSEWWDNLLRADPIWLLVGALVVLPHTALKILRMERLLPELKDYRGSHLRLSYAMVCVGQLPTGTIGGDAFRIVKYTGLGLCEKHCTAATAIMRLTGFSTTLLVGGFLGAWYLGSVWPLLAVALSVLILFLLGTSAHPVGLVDRIRVDPESRRDDDPGFLTRIGLGFRKILSRTLDQAKDLPRRKLAEMVGVTFGLIALRAVILWCCAKAVGLDIGWMGAVFALCAGNLMSSIPSPAGSVGLREGGIVGAFGILGGAATLATIASVLFRLVVIAGALLGWGLSALIWDKMSEQANPEPA